MAKKRIIFSTLYNEEDWKEDYENELEETGRDKDDYPIYEFIQDEIERWRECEEANLGEPCGDILAIADLGLWDGRQKAYKIFRNCKVNQVLWTGRDTNDMEVYCDQYNVISEQYHHDGCNVVEFRLIKPDANIQPLLNAICNETVTREMVRRYTKSLRPMVAKVYGW